MSDPSGAVVPLAVVELTSKDTNAIQSQPTNSSGQYVFTGVRPGSYKLTVKLAGFRTASVPSVLVEVNKATELAIKLEVGGDNQVVEVTATAVAQLQTTDAQIGNSISMSQISRLPALGRNVTELMNLQPGVVPTGSNLGMRTTGAIDDQNTVTLDGIDVTAVVTASGTSVPTPQDSVEEFRVTVSNGNSDLSRASGGQMTLVGRHGGNTMHGSGYGLFQNSVLNSNTWDNNAAKIKKPDISDKRYGGRWGGALKKD
ncbi:MAG: carboxypeptidase-like regulatory domain-containing protein, partial [Bryobacteraceae bacterium]